VSCPARQVPPSRVAPKDTWEQLQHTTYPHIGAQIMSMIGRAAARTPICSGLKCITVLKNTMAYLRTKSGTTQGIRVRRTR